jgi:hypothetical protein
MLTKPKKFRSCLKDALKDSCCGGGAVLAGMGRACHVASAIRHSPVSIGSSASTSPAP